MEITLIARFIAIAVYFGFDYVNDWFYLLEKRIADDAIELMAQDIIRLSNCRSQYEYAHQKS